MTVPVLPLELLTQHADLLHFFTETDPTKLASLTPAIKKEYVFTLPDGREMCLSTVRLAIAYGKPEALKQLNLDDEDKAELFMDVFRTLMSERDIHEDKVVIVPECSHEVIRYLLTIDRVKVAFLEELRRLHNLHSGEKERDDLLRIISRSFELFTEILFGTSVRYSYEWMYFIRILKHSSEKAKIINYLHTNREIELTVDTFGRLLTMNDGSAGEVLEHYISPAEILALDYTGMDELASRPGHAQAGLKSLLLESPSLALKASVVLIFKKEQISEIYDDLIAGSALFPHGIKVIVDGHALGHVTPTASAGAGRAHSGAISGFSWRMQSQDMLLRWGVKIGTMANIVALSRYPADDNELSKALKFLRESHLLLEENPAHQEYFDYLILNHTKAEDHARLLYELHVSGINSKVNREALGTNSEHAYYVACVLVASRSWEMRNDMQWLYDLLVRNKEFSASIMVVVSLLSGPRLLNKANLNKIVENVAFAEQLGDAIKAYTFPDTEFVTPPDADKATKLQNILKILEAARDPARVISRPLTQSIFDEIVSRLATAASSAPVAAGAGRDDREHIIPSSRVDTSSRGGLASMIGAFFSGLHFFAPTPPAAGAGARAAEEPAAVVPHPVNAAITAVAAASLVEPGSERHLPTKAELAELSAEQLKSMTRLTGLDPHYWALGEVFQKRSVDEDKRYLIGKGFSLATFEILFNAIKAVNEAADDAGEPGGEDRYDNFIKGVAWVFWFNEHTEGKADMFSILKEQWQDAIYLPMFKRFGKKEAGPKEFLTYLQTYTLENARHDGILDIEGTDEETAFRRMKTYFVGLATYFTHAEELIRSTMSSHLRTAASSTPSAAGVSTSLADLGMFPAAPSAVTGAGVGARADAVSAFKV